MRYRDMPCLGFTHYQPAQLVTVGKRAALWCYDFVRCLWELEKREGMLEFRGVKGTTGTQESFMKLFDGDESKVKALEMLVAGKMGFSRVSCITSQTHSRLIDAAVLQTVALIGAAAQKMCCDIRHLANLKEMEEPFEKNQVGSSAMAYKRNPMRCERVVALSRWLMTISVNGLHTAAEQWLERSLDDSANRRLSIPEVFLTADAILQTVLNVSQGLVVYPKVIEAHVAAELPFMATEEIIMEAVKSGGDRQALHEAIRVHSQEAAQQVKEFGRPNDLIERLNKDPLFANANLDGVLDPRKFIGRAPSQVIDFNAGVIAPLLRDYEKELGLTGKVKV
jgi:adenylosuccinate lyase